VAQGMVIPVLLLVGSSTRALDSTLKRFHLATLACVRPHDGKIENALQKYEGKRLGAISIKNRFRLLKN
jgi:hypothetical protein